LIEGMLREGLARGQHGARRWLLEHHGGAVYTWFLLRPMDPASAEACTTIFMERIFKQRPPPKVHPEVWLYQELLAESAPTRPSQPATTTEAAFRRLPAELRTVLFLRDIAGLLTESVAAVLSLPISTIRARLHRARTELEG